MVPVSQSERLDVTKPAVVFWCSLIYVLTATDCCKKKKKSQNAILLKKQDRKQQHEIELKKTQVAVYINNRQMCPSRIKSRLKMM